MNHAYRLDGRKTLCNVGSVGQPRDLDPRACYVLYDGETIRYRRVEYDFEVTIRKIYDIPDLDNFLGDRLRGRVGGQESAVSGSYQSDIRLSIQYQNSRAGPRIASGAAIFV